MRLFTFGHLLGGALFLVSSYILLRLRNSITGIEIIPDNLMVSVLAALGILAALYILWEKIRRDAVRTFL